jgi:HK97 family phage major capsid protein
VAPSFEIVQHTSTVGSAGVTAEGAIKPEIQLGLTHITLPMVKIASNSAVSWKVISDYDRFTSYLQLELPLRVVDVENQQPLYGTGQDRQITGLYSTPNILTHDCSGHSATEYLDDVEESIEQLRSGPALAEPDLFVTSPSSWSAPRRIKDDLHRYILSPDPTSSEAMSLWGVEVLVTTQAIPGDGVLVDTSKMGKAIIREGISFRQGTAEDDFIRNLLRWIVEERLNLGVERPSAVLYLSNLPMTTGSWSS